MSRTSDFRHRPDSYRDSKLFEVEYWVTGKEAYNHFKVIQNYMIFLLFQNYFYEIGC